MSKENIKSRRNFLKNSALASTLFLPVPEIINTSFAAAKTKRIKVKEGDVILFQGDSITDAGRKKDDLAPNSAGAFGTGYAMIAASELLHRGAGKNLKIYNRGISGNKVFQLADRWEKDCLDLKPNLLSILVGVNDFWHTLTSNYTGTIQTYTNDFTALLQRTKDKLPDVQLIIGEPYAVPGIKAVDDKWYPAFNDYRTAAKSIAAQFGAAFIPYQTIYDNAQKKAPGVYWTGDGVHPTLAGAQLMASAWMEMVEV